MKPDDYTEDKPKNHFEWGYLYKVYLVILIAVFLLALANQANAGVFLEINGNMDYYDSQLPLGDIMQNSDTWDAVSNYMNDVHGVPFPSYSEATQMDDLLENVLMYYVGQYCNLSGTTAQQVYDTCMDFTDTASQVWDLLTLDLESGDFIATPNHSGDLSDVIHGVVDPLIYNDGSSDSPVVGYWYPMGVKSDIVVQSNGSKLQNEFLSNYGDVYVCAFSSGNYTCFAFASKSLESRSAYINRYYDPTGSSGLSYNTTYNFNLTNPYSYAGRIAGYYNVSSMNYTNGSFYGTVGIGGLRYSDLSTALTDFYGSDWTVPPSEPYLNGDGYIINDNPTFAPLSGYSALRYPYRTKIVENHTNTTDPDDPVGYPEGVNIVEPNPVYKDVPTWLVDPTVDIPEEPDYLENVDVELPEIEPDTGFITDCYNALPSGIVSMIAVGLGLGVVMKIIS